MNHSRLLKYLKDQQGFDHESLGGFEALIAEYPWFSLAWVLRLKNLQALSAPVAPNILAQTALRVTNRGWLSRFLAKKPVALSSGIGYTDEYLVIADYPIENSEVQDEENKITHKEKSDLIDMFLTTGGTIGKKSLTDPATPAHDIAGRAESENDDIFTETFVNLLIAQKKYDKALVALEKLSLKFPEKSIYFAARIEEIKSLMNI